MNKGGTSDRVRESNSEKEIPTTSISPAPTASLQQNEPAAQSTTTKAETGQTAPHSPYDSFCTVIKYSKFFIIRLVKDLCKTAMGTDSDVAVELLRAQQRLASELREPSEDSLDVYIPSFPGSPRSLSLKDESDESVNRAALLNSLVEQGNELIWKDEEFKKVPKDGAIKKVQEETNILVAAEIGDNQTIARLIKRNVDVQVTDHLGRNALHFAVQNGNLRAIEMLLQAGIKATIKDDVGMTPLLLCLMRNPSIKIARLLFDYGAVILPRGSPMDTGLFIQFVMMCTPTPEDEEILRLLVDKGALVDDPGAPGQRQPLHFAAMSNNCDLIRILLELGANPYATNHRNETPKDVAKIYKCKEAASLLASIENFSIYGVAGEPTS